ncbi:uncharacterized protein EDB91DRAFT_1234529 [Suillus paluster]|uniref:uncharacterized protein n=1 Tax=Suillus paluster TaxID=48578 RepID=UPI001B8689C6|nr:uncharacterized protein EDB91DRAFT_1234529 [Suillus paluster]KAG1752507.1 hypothetical protein EDB91DRAFT_1234529 [Suillus paluster]
MCLIQSFVGEGGRASRSYNSSFSVDLLRAGCGWKTATDSNAFANNGAKVYFTSRRQDVIERAAKHWGSSLAHPKGKLVPVTSDITSKDSIKQPVQEISKQEDHINLLVNNAGISEGTGDVEKGDESAKYLSTELFREDPVSWENVYRTNVIGCFFMTTAFLPLLHATSHSNSQHTGSVINISSISGITRTTQHHYKYNVSKAAVIHSTLLAQEFRRKAVQVTGGSDEFNKSQIPVGENYGENKGIPVCRPGRDEVIAQAALLLACNQYAYGQALVIDGRMSTIMHCST